MMNRLPNEWEGWPTVDAQSGWKLRGSLCSFGEFKLFAEYGDTKWSCNCKRTEWPMKEVEVSVIFRFEQSPPHYSGVQWICTRCLLKSELLTPKERVWIEAIQVRSDLGMIQKDVPPPKRGELW
jgi:hypothetical protein